MYLIPIVSRWEIRGEREIGEWESESMTGGGRRRLESVE